MKKISEHLGTIVVALAAVALLITAITFFKAPISGFFESIIEKEVAVGEKMLDGLEDVDAPSLSGGSGNAGQTYLAAPTISLEGDTLTISSVDNAEEYAIYVDGEYKTSVSAVRIPTVKGVWVFNDVLTGSNNVVQNINFNTAKGDYTQIKFDISDGYIQVSYRYVDAGTSSSRKVYTSYDNTGWFNSSDKQVDFGSTPQEVSQEFYEWLEANATQVVEDLEVTPVTFDLSTLDLEPGTYSITVKAKGAGYADSEASAAVSYTVGDDSIVGTWLIESFPDGTESFAVQNTPLIYAVEQVNSNNGFMIYNTFDTIETYRNVSFYHLYDSVYSGIYYFREGKPFGYRSTYEPTTSRATSDVSVTLVIPEYDEKIYGFNPDFVTWLKANATKQ